MASIKAIDVLNKIRGGTKVLITLDCDGSCLFKGDSMKALHFIKENYPLADVWSFSLSPSCKYFTIELWN